jgi:hypothetical protein
MAWKNKGIACVLLLLLAALVLPQSGGVPPVQAESRALTALNDSIRVDISCGTGPCSGSKISNSNTTRKLVVSSTGVIFALFWNTSGIWVSKSTNRGATFSAPKRVTATSVEGEIAISGDGTLYVSWNDSSTYKISKSTNAGNTWGAPITIGAATSSSATLHTAVDGDYIYAVIQNGTKVYVSSNAGVTWAEKALSVSGQVYSDIHVDPLTHNIYAFLDNPSVKWYLSTDRGLTWSSEKTTGKNVYYSVGALTNNGTDKYFYMAGNGVNLERINLTDESVETKTVAASDGSTTRSLAADSCGNVISGNKTGSDLYLQYSTDSGSTFSTAELVEAGADRSSASINYTNGDVMYLYEKAGQVFLSTFAGLLGGAGSCYALTISRTAVEFTRPGEDQVITLKNTSRSSMAVTSITLTGTAFTRVTTCKASIPAGGTCTITISGETEASELLTLVIGGITKKIPVSLGELAGDRPTATEVPPTRTPTLPGTATNTAIPTATSTPTNTPTFTPTLTPSPIPLLMKKGAVGASFVLGLLQNKTLVTWGMNREFQTNIPPCCGTGIDDIAVGTNFALALKGGKVYGWGANTLKQITFPATVNKDIVSIAAGGSHGLALSKKGLVFAWGDNGFKQATPPKGLKDVVSIAAGKAHSLVVKKDGTVVAWGANESGQTKVPPAIVRKPKKKVVQVAGGLDHSVALLDDATVLAWGGNAKGQSTVPGNAKDMKQVSAGNQFTLAVRKDGTVFGWGSNEYNQLLIPAEFTDIYNANAGYSNTILGLRNGRIIVLGDQSNGVNASRTPTKTATPTP